MLVTSHLIVDSKVHFRKQVIITTMDKFQFSYCSNRCVEDAVNQCLHFILNHLEQSQQRLSNNLNYSRILFIDYSSAFSTIGPNKLYLKLLDLDIPKSLCHWLLDFLINRKQIVRIGSMMSQSLVLNTGTPQGCCLPPLLFSLFTHDCVATSQSNLIVKFADDTTVSGLIGGSDEDVTEMRHRS